LSWFISKTTSVFFILSKNKIKAMRYLLLFCCIMIQHLVVAQDYQLTSGNEAFTSLSLPNTPIDWPFDWDDETAILPFGFSFPVGDLTYDSLFLSSNGWAVSTDAQYEFNAYYVDLIAAGDETSVAYKTENVDGENVLKIEFLNAGFYEDTTGTARTSFQFWFYESGCWESRIGPSTLVDTVLIFEQYPGPFIGYANYTLESVQALVGPSLSPEILTIDSIAFPSLSDAPIDGMFYSFCTESSASIENTASSNLISIAPNPADAFVFIRSALSGNWRLVDISGRVLTRGFKSKEEELVDLTNFASGVYVFQMDGAEAIKLIRK
jgi:hypothetical protein